MDEPRIRWGKAGVRLTDAEAAAIDARHARRRAEAKVRDEREECEVRDFWARGMLRPFSITHALDGRGLYGPEVDEACGTFEPAVDMWEDGQLYPTWPELKALARLVDYPLGYFMKHRDHLPFEATSMRFHLKPGEKPPPPPVLCFAPEAIQAATGTTRCPHCHLSAVPVMPAFAFCPHCGARQQGGAGSRRTLSTAPFAHCSDCGGQWPTGGDRV